MPDPMYAASDWQMAYDRARQAVEWEMAHQRARGSVAPQSWGDWLSTMVSPRSAEAEVLPRDAQATAALQVALQGNEPSLVASQVPGMLPAFVQQYQPDAASRAQVDPFKRVLYQTIAQQAQRDPREVTVRYGDTQSPTAIADYNRQRQAVTLSQHRLGMLPPGDPRTQDALGHELVHFLLKAPGQAYSGDEHPLIRYLLGISSGRSDTPAYVQQARPFTASQHPTAEFNLMQQQVRDNPADPRARYVNQDYNAVESMTPEVADALRLLLQGTALQHGVWQENR